MLQEHPRDEPARRDLGALRSPRRRHAGLDRLAHRQAVAHRRAGATEHALKDYSERLNEDAAYVFPEPEGIADEKTLALANQFLEQLAAGMFPDGQIDP